MKRTLTVLLLALCVMQTVCQTCDTEGYRTLSTPINEVYCYPCNRGYSKCVNGSALFDSISSDAYKIESDVVYARCGNFANRYYNEDAKTCDSICDVGCSTCTFTTSFCLTCQSGFVWNSDYSCHPLIVPFQGVTLFFIVVAIVGAVMMVMNTRKTSY